MDERLAVAPIVADFAERVRPIAGVAGFYAGGSIGSRDYRPGLSDLDLVAVIDSPLTRHRREKLRDFHRTLGVPKLHCAYVPAGATADVAQKHVTWAHERMFRRPFSGISRTELHQFGVTVYGPGPGEVFPPLSSPALAEAARVELRGYWRYAVRRRKLWLTDLHVDLGLTTVSRADVTITSGRLITKTAAIERLPALGVPKELALEIARRRRGELVILGDEERRERGGLVRDVMRRQLDRLLASSNTFGQST